VGAGDITVGRIGRCAAVRPRPMDQQLAMLVWRPRKSLEDHLDRLDTAIDQAWNEEEYIDEINP
jgi:hypothetical protein